MMVEQVEGKFRTQDILSQEACRTGLINGFFTALIDFPDFTVNIVITTGRTHGIPRNDHPFDQGMGL